MKNPGSDIFESNTTPLDGATVIIPCAWDLVYYDRESNHNDFEIGTLIVDGKLIF